MAVIHETTMKPGKLDLLAAWLPAQPWYLGAGRREPRLTRAGGFRLDDPAGEVGIEFMVVADAAAEDIVYYLVPMTYRGHPLAGAGAGAGADSGTVTVAGTGAGVVTVVGADASTGTDAGDGLIGTAEHGVLGRRWIYDGVPDGTQTRGVFVSALNR